MKHALKTSLLTGVLLFLIPALSNSDIYAQESYDLTGCWTFEKAEYRERTSPASEYQLKYTIEKEENLGSLVPCYQYAVSMINFYSGDFVVFSCLFNTYIASYQLPFGIPSSFGKQVPIIIGDNERIGEETPIENMIYNTPQMHYQLVLIDNQTIAIILERVCFENSVSTEGAVKCILKRKYTDE